MGALERRNEGLTDPELDITVVGGGATGVELAGTLAELRNVALPAVYPQIDRSMFQRPADRDGPGAAGARTRTACAGTPGSSW